MVFLNICEIIKCEEIKNWLMTYGLKYGIKGIALIVLFVVIWRVINKLCKVTYRFFEKLKLEPEIVMFLNSVVKILLRVVLILTVLASFGVNINTLLATLGASLVTFGLALKDNLSNFASGLFIILNKPFKIGDTIEFEGHTGKVLKIKTANTTLQIDDKLLIIPNSKLVNGSIIKHR